VAFGICRTVTNGNVNDLTNATGYDYYAGAGMTYSATISAARKSYQDQGTCSFRVAEMNVDGTSPTYGPTNESRHFTDEFNFVSAYRHARPLK